VTRQHSSVRYCAPSSVLYQASNSTCYLQNIENTYYVAQQPAGRRSRKGRVAHAMRHSTAQHRARRHTTRAAPSARGSLTRRNVYKKIKTLQQRMFQRLQFDPNGSCEESAFGNSQGRIELGSARVTAFQARERVVLRICYCVVARVTALRLRLSFIDSRELSATIAPPKVCCALPDRHTMTHPSCSTCCAATPTCAAPPH
jgi:hypothetical protein